MAIISKSMLGGISGAVGAVVVANWKGITYIRSRPAPGKTKFSEPQLAQQAKFAVAVNFLLPIRTILKLSFGDDAVNMTGYNNAISYTLNNAVVGNYPSFMIDYSLALISRGKLLNAISPTANPGINGEVNFRWIDNTGMGKAKGSDKTILLVYCPSLKQAIYTAAGANRSACTGSLQVTAFSGLQVQTYLGFVAGDGKTVANSIFTGQLTVL